MWRGRWHAPGAVGEEAIVLVEGRRPRVAVIGAGFAGIGMAVRLLQEGYDDLVILEQADDVGGTWRDNTYPGVACDIPAHLYSFSFHPRAEWTTAYPRQWEIKQYLDEVVEAHGLRRYLELGTAIEQVRYDDGAATWTLTADDGRTFVVDVVIGGLGPLRVPSYPSIEGRGSFAGPTMHTARWDHSVDLEGRRVGVVGTGASGVQVVPPVAEEAASLTVFQRSAPWMIPMLDRTYSEAERWIFANVPGARWLYRTALYWQKEIRFVGFREDSLAMRLMEAYARWNMRHKIDDPQLREELEAGYRMGCKRILLSNRYYDALNRDHVEVVTDPIARVVPDGVETAAGRHIPLDVIVWATGFEVANMLGPMQVTGTGGRDLQAAWDEVPRAYMGTTVPGFPNLFLLLGPNTGLGHNSMVFMMESQYGYVLDALARLRRPGVAALDVREQALEDWIEEVTERTGETVWATGCDSWYLSDEGTNFTLWPGFTFEYWLRARELDPGAYRVIYTGELEEARRQREPVGALTG